MAAPPIRVVSPATGELLAEVPDEGAAGIAAAVDAARAAAPAWAARPLAKRVEALKSWRDALLDDAYSLAGTLVAESGKPRHEAEAFEILYLCELIRFAGKNQQNAILMMLLAPGLWLQRLTTRQPSLDQIEVSIRALQEVLLREGGVTPEERKVEVMA